MCIRSYFELQLFFKDFTSKKKMNFIKFLYILNFLKLYFELYICK